MPANNGEDKGSYETNQNVLPVSKVEDGVIFIDVIGSGREHGGQRQQEGKLGGILPVQTDQEPSSAWLESW